MQRGKLGTAPIQVVQYAQHLFKNGDLHKGIRPKSFDQVYVVFDRDDHESYFDALRFAESLDRNLRNEEGQPVSFRAIASIPSFELWLLLHFEDALAPIHRDEVMARLKLHIPTYEKSAGGVFAATRKQLDYAMHRTATLAMRFTAYTAPEPYTALHELVKLLTTLRE